MKSFVYQVSPLIHSINGGGGGGGGGGTQE